MNRRITLATKWFFDCTCQRCQDPTELNTFLNAMLCLKCTGPVLPTQPLLYNCDPWKCLECGWTLTLDQVQSIVTEMMESLKNHQGEGGEIIEHYENFISSYSERAHPNHELLIEAQSHLAHLYGNIKGYSLESLSRPLLSRKKQVTNNPRL